MKIVALFSGGKDSTYSLFQAINAGHEVKYLITFRPKNMDSYMFHHPCIEFTSMQAEAIGVNQIIVDTGGEKEKELDDLENILVKIKDEIDGVVSGALASNYQKSRIDDICNKLGLESLAPLWNVDTELHWKTLLEKNFVVVITSVASEGLDEGWLGRVIDHQTVEELKYIKDRFGLHLGFEGGEAETFVCNGPIFRKKIEIVNYKKIWNNKTHSGYIKIEEAKLVPK